MEKPSSSFHDDDMSSYFTSQLPEKILWKTGKSNPARDDVRTVLPNDHNHCYINP
jgi:hypothetical protein